MQGKSIDIIDMHAVVSYIYGLQFTFSFIDMFAYHDQLIN